MISKYKKSKDKINELFNNEKETQWFCPYESKIIKALARVGDNH